MLLFYAVVKQIISNITGVYVLNNNRVIEKQECRTAKDIAGRNNQEQLFLKKYPVVKEITLTLTPELSTTEAVKKLNLLLTKLQLKASVNEDNIIIQTINALDDVTKISNSLCKRLREWYALYLPEASEKITINETFVKIILTKKKSQLMKDLQLHETMGADLKQQDVDEILMLGEKIQSMYQLKQQLEQYLDRVFQEYAPNLQAVAGTIIAAQLLRHAGSLQRLSEMPSSTVQLLGAEDALFKHLRQKAKCPKHGLIVNHPLLANIKASERGKQARHLTGALSIAAKVDYFKGDKHVGEKLRRELEQKAGVQR